MPHVPRRLTLQCLIVLEQNVDHYSWFLWIPGFTSISLGLCFTFIELQSQILPAETVRIPSLGVVYSAVRSTSTSGSCLTHPNGLVSVFDRQFFHCGEDWSPTVQTVSVSFSLYLEALSSPPWQALPFSIGNYTLHNRQIVICSRCVDISSLVLLNRPGSLR